MAPSTTNDREHASERWIGLDVGGANLKAADSTGKACSEAFALWRKPEKLSVRLSELLSRFDPSTAAGVALTMTGELADCYATKADGVRAIVEATTAAANDLPTVVATVDDAWLSPAEAVAAPMRVAAANWRLIARYAAKHLAADAALIVDIGSTTTDLIPLARGQVVSRGRTDTQRLLAGELLYTGVRRTPVCAIVESLPYRGQSCPVAAELFATVADAWLLLDKLPESDRTDTADGRPLTKPHATARLARCVCADRDEFNNDDAMIAAKAIADQQTTRVRKAIDAQLRSLDNRAELILSGEGAWLAELALEESEFMPPTVRLEATLGSLASDCAAAATAAILASEEVSA